MAKKTSKSIPSLKSVIRKLKKMTIGERAWFWFCSEAKPAALIVTNLRDDPAMRELGKQVGTLRFSSEARIVSGIIHVSENGTFAFGSTSASSTFFDELSDWVLHTSIGNPDVDILKNSTVQVINENGKVVQRIDQPDRWLGMVSPNKIGSIEDSLDIFQKLKVGEQVWFWMTDSGPAGHPYFISKRVKKDPNGENFAGEVEAVRRRSTALGKEFVGSGLKSSHSLLLTATSGSGSVAEILQAIHAHYGEQAALVTHARVFKLKGGKQKEITIELGNASSSKEIFEETLLSSISAGEKLQFWFNAGSNGQESTLLLGADKSEFKERVKTMKSKKSNSIQGSVRMSSKGFLEFKSKDSIADFIPTLAQWVDHHLTQTATRKKMIGARFIQQSSDGTVISKQKDQSAWSFIN